MLKRMTLRWHQLPTKCRLSRPHILLHHRPVHGNDCLQVATSCQCWTKRPMGGPWNITASAIWTMEDATSLRVKRSPTFQNSLNIIPVIMPLDMQLSSPGKVRTITHKQLGGLHFIRWFLEQKYDDFYARQHSVAVIANIEMFVRLSVILRLKLELQKKFTDR